MHADPEARKRLRHISEDERLFAAVVWVADATKLATEQLIIDLTDAKYSAPVRDEDFLATVPVARREL